MSTSGRRREAGRGRLELCGSNSEALGLGYRLELGDQAGLWSLSPCKEDLERLFQDLFDHPTNDQGIGHLDSTVD